MNDYPGAGSAEYLEAFQKLQLLLHSGILRERPEERVR